MDFSPYRKKGHSSLGSSTQKYFPLLILLGGLFGIFLVLWFGYLWLFPSTDTAVSSLFSKTEGSVVESQIAGIDAWSILSDGEELTEGEKIRVLSGNTSSITLKNGSVITLAAGSEIALTSTKETKEGAFFGEMIMVSGPIAFVAKGNMDETKLFKIWVDENHYIVAESGSFMVENGNVHIITGEGIHAIEQNAKGKISNQKTLGVGQSLSINDFSITATEESTKYLPLYAMLSGSTLSASPLASLEITPPIITNFPFNGTAITVKDPLQKIEGTADTQTKKLIASFTNGQTTTEQEIIIDADKKWSYIASPTYDTMIEGINTYKFYAVNEKNQRSAPGLLVLQYNPNAENVFTENTGELMITSPNQGKSGSIEGNIITLVGTAPKNAAKIIVTNKKLQNPYTLQKFTAGDTTWKYYTASLEPGVYDYSIQAIDATGKSIGVKNISITIVSATIKPSPSVSSLATASPTPSLSKSPTPKPNISPSISTSTLEAQR